MSPPLTLTISSTDPALVLLAGELDLDTAPHLLRGIASWAAATDGGDLRVSCNGLTFVDSTGLHALCAALERAATPGRTVSLVDPAPALRRLLELTGLAAVLLAA